MKARFKTVYIPSSGLFAVYDTLLAENLLKFRDEDAADHTVVSLNSMDIEQLDETLNARGA